MGRIVVSLGIIVGLPMSLVIGTGVWFGASREHLPILYTWGLLGVGVVLTLVAVSLLAVAATNYGVIVEEGGVAALERSLRRAWVLRTNYEWRELQGAMLVGPLRGSVKVETDDREFFLSRREARVVLLDPRCPLRSKLAPDLASSLSRTL